MAHPTPLPDVSTLTVAQRLELIGKLWDSIPDEQVEVTVPGWHEDELDRRIAEADADPNGGIPLDTVLARLKGQQ